MSKILVGTLLKDFKNNATKEIAFPRGSFGIAERSGSVWMVRLPGLKKPLPVQPQHISLEQLSPAEYAKKIKPQADNNCVGEKRSKPPSFVDPNAKIRRTNSSVDVHTQVQASEQYPPSLNKPNPSPLPKKTNSSAKPPSRAVELRTKPKKNKPFTHPERHELAIRAEESQYFTNGSRARFRAQVYDDLTFRSSKSLNDCIEELAAMRKYVLSTKTDFKKQSWYKIIQRICLTDRNRTQFVQSGLDAVKLSQAQGRKLARKTKAEELAEQRQKREENQNTIANAQKEMVAAQKEMTHVVQNYVDQAKERNISTEMRQSNQGALLAIVSLMKVSQDRKFVAEKDLLDSVSQAITTFRQISQPKRDILIMLGNLLSNYSDLVPVDEKKETILSILTSAGIRELFV